MKYWKISLALFLGTGIFFSACNDSKTGDNKEATTDPDKEDIRKLMDAYNGHFIKGEYAAMTDYIYPPIFQEFSKEEMIADMKGSMHSNEFDVTIKRITIDSISTVYTHNADKYALSTHRAQAAFQFKDDVPDDILRAYCINFSQSFGEDNVKCNTAEKNFDIIMPDVSFLIYSDKQKKWYTLGTSSEQDLEKYFPKEIRNKMTMPKK